MSYDVAGGLKNLLPGALDDLWGPYPTVAAANAAIPNNVVAGKSYRLGKKVAIGLTAPYAEYWWSGTDYADDKLLPTIDLTKISSSVTSIFTDGSNQYDYTKDVKPGSYIHTTNGSLQSDLNSSVSQVFPCVAGQVVYLLNRTGNGGFRFLDASSAPILPKTTAGVTFANYSAQMNGGFMAPDNAVGFQYTTMFVGTTNRTNIILSSNATGKQTIKESWLPVPSYIAGMNNTIASNYATLAIINNPVSITRVNKGENTTAPSAFPASTESLNRFGVTVVNDTDSPVAKYVGKKRVFSNTLTADKATLYNTWDIPLGSLRPSIISYAFWVKKAEFTSIYTNNYLAYLGLKTFSVPVAPVLSGTPQTVQASTDVRPDVDTAIMTMTKIAEQGLYVRLRVTFSSIVWKSTFAGTTIQLYYLFNGANFFNKTMDFIDFTVLFDAEPEGTTVYADPDGLFGGYPLSMVGLQDQIKQNKLAIAAVSNTNTGASSEATLSIRSGNILYFSSKYNSTRNLVKRMDYARAINTTNNPNSNFIQTFLADTAGDQSVVALNLKSSTDDICPAKINGSYIAGNHGWNFSHTIQKTAHSKTVADIGSIYVAPTGTQFVILNIIDANNIVVCSKNKSTDGYTYSFEAPVGDLVYNSNGTNTATITGYTAAPISNLYTLMSAANTTILTDGKTVVTAGGDYKCNFVDVRESYSVFDLPSTIDKLITGRPSGGYSATVPLNSVGADKLFTHNIVYRFLANGTTLVMHNFRTHKKLLFNFHGFVQAQALATGKLYCPKSLPVSGGNKTYNFTTLEDWSTGPTNEIHLTPEYWENSQSPPDRVVNLNSDVVFHIGYLTDRGVGLNRKNNVNDAIFLAQSKKIYPMGASISKVMEANEFYSAVAFRQFINPANNPAGRTNFSWFELDGIVWVHLDYHGSLADSIPVQKEWVGRKIEVYEKNANVKVLADVVSDSIEVLSTATSSSYGFAVLKLT